MIVSISANYVSSHMLHFNSTMGWLWAWPWEELHQHKVFQFHYGMIVSFLKASIRARNGYFNSTMGWLWGMPNGVVQAIPTRFQFHYGMIVRMITSCKPLSFTDFNSTMGWLWARADVLNNGSWRFQFHYGMIVRLLLEVGLVGFVISIPLWDDCEPPFSNADKHIKQFQFHYGMIVRPAAATSWLNFLDFNSTMGWLWDRFFNLFRSCFQISIPLWDDCEILFGIY